jgi:hypothetical protein
MILIVIESGGISQLVSSSFVVIRRLPAFALQQIIPGVCSDKINMLSITALPVPEKVQRETSLGRSHGMDAPAGDARIGWAGAAGERAGHPTTQGRKRHCMSRARCGFATWALKFGAYRTNSSAREVEGLRP